MSLFIFGVVCAASICIGYQCRDKLDDDALGVFLEILGGIGLCATLVIWLIAICKALWG